MDNLNITGNGRFAIGHGDFGYGLGVKTGLNPDAGGCLIAMAQREGTRVLLVMLHIRNRWHDAAAMLDRAFQRKGAVPFANSSSVELEGIADESEGE